MKILPRFLLVGILSLWIGVVVVYLALLPTAQVEPSDIPIQPIVASFHNGNTDNISAKQQEHSIENQYDPLQTQPHSESQSDSESMDSESIDSESMDSESMDNESVDDESMDSESMESAEEAPTIEDYIGRKPNGRKYLLQDASRLLQIGHLGFPKCGSSFFRTWLYEHEEVLVGPREDQIFQGRVVRTIEKLIRIHPNDGKQVAYKNSNELYSPKAMGYLRKHFVKTKMVVGIRHPVLWFESFYNFRTIDYGLIGNATQLIGPCIHDEHVCTDKARFHYYMAREFRKTPMSAKAELDLLNDTISEGTVGQNPVFFYEMKQLSDETRSFQFRKDLSQFLGLSKVLPSATKVKPEHKLPHSRIVEGKRHQINICDGAYTTLRQVLMGHANSMADWIQQYFLPSTNVYVSDHDYVYQLMDSYREDPCNSRQ